MGIVIEIQMKIEMEMLPLDRDGDEGVDMAMMEV